MKGRKGKLQNRKNTSNKNTAEIHCSTFIYIHYHLIRLAKTQQKINQLSVKIYFQ